VNMLQHTAFEPLEYTRASYHSAAHDLGATPLD